MSYGLRIWNADGSVLVDITTRLSRIVNVVTLPAGGSGTIDLSAYPGDPWFKRMPISATTIGYVSTPVVTIVGKTIQWSNGSASNATLIYGIR